MEAFPTKKARIRGNALFIILIAIALLGALTTAVMQSGRSPSFKQKETTQLQATKIIKYGLDLQAGADFLLMRGTDPYGIDFVAPDNGAFNTPPNANKMFHPEGAGVIYQTNSLSGMAPYSYTKTTQIAGHGIGFGGKPEIAFAAEVTRDICQEINKNLYGYTTIPYIAAANMASLLSGAATSFSCVAVSGRHCSGKTSMCITDLNGGVAANEHGVQTFYAGWTLNGEVLRLPRTMMAPQTQQVYAAAGNETYTYFRVLVTQ